MEGLEERTGLLNKERGIKRYELPVIKETSQEDERYGRGNIVDNIVTESPGDYTYHGKQSNEQNH